MKRKAIENISSLKTNMTNLDVRLKKMNETGDRGSLGTNQTQ